MNGKRVMVNVELLRLVCSPGPFKLLQLLWEGSGAKVLNKVQSCRSKAARSFDPMKTEIRFQGVSKSTPTF